MKIFNGKLLSLAKGQCFFLKVYSRRRSAGYSGKRIEPSLKPLHEKKEAHLTHRNEVTMTLAEMRAADGERTMRAECDEEGQRGEGKAGCGTKREREETRTDETELEY